VTRVFTPIEFPDCFTPCVNGFETPPFPLLPPAPPQSGHEAVFFRHWWRIFFEGGPRFVNVRVDEIEPGEGGREEAVVASSGRSPRFVSRRSRNWSGAVARARQGQRFDRVIAGWTVPSLLGTVPEVLPAIQSIWVGMGGHARWSNSMPQLGTEHGWDKNGKPFHRFWCQWWLGDDRDGFLASIIKPIAAPEEPEPCQQILVSMVALDPRLVLLHLRYGDFVFGVKAIGKRPYVGSSAEWTAERPTEVYKDTETKLLVKGDLIPLPKTSLIEMTSCHARLKGQALGLENRVVSPRDDDLVALSERRDHPTRTIVSLEPTLAAANTSVVFNRRQPER
jgi:hypothetical protein